MIGGGGINDESNKSAPAPKRNADLTKDTVVHRRNPYAVAHVHESADSFPSVRTGPLPHARRRAANVLGDVDATLPGDDASGGPGPDVKRIRGGGTATMPRIPGHPVRQAPLGRVPQLGDHLLQRHASPEAHVDGFPPLRLAEHSGLQSGHSRVQLFVRIPNLAPKMRRPSQIERRITNLR